MFVAAIIVLAAIVFLVPVLPQTGSVAQYVIGEIVKGSHVGAYSSPNPTAPTEIAENPADLAASANLDLETYTLARIISSEEGNSPLASQVAIAWACRNNTSEGSGIFEWATDGSYGKQWGGIANRPCSTWQDPYEGHVTVAKGVMSGAFPDPTGGAKQWVAPKTQDILAARDPSKYKPFAQVNAARIAGGLRQVNPDGVDPALLVFYA
jgi:hypothetical protein